MVFVADAEFRHEVADGPQDPSQRIPVAGEDHPGCKLAGAAFTEGVEGHVGDFAGVRLTSPRLFNSGRNLAVDAVGHEARQFRLEPCRRAEMMKEIGVSLAHLSRDGLEGHCLRATFNEDAARCFKRVGAAFFRAKAFTSY